MATVPQTTAMLAATTTQLPTMMATVPMATVPMATVPMATVPMATGMGQCNNVAIPDYATLREQNMNKISNYYKQLLDGYTSNYRDFSTQSASANVNDRKYATTALKSKVDDYNTQLINLSKTMINSVNQDMDLINAQKDELQRKTKQIDTTMNNITLLKDKDNEMSVLTGSRNDSLSFVKTGTEDMSFSTYIYIGINSLFLLIILGIVIYIVYSSYSVATNNRSRAINNIMRNNIRGNRV